MRPRKHFPTGAGDLFRARLDQIINMKHELVQLAERIDWEWLDGEIAALYADKGRPGIETRFVLKHIFALSASAGSTTPISSTSPGRSFSSTPSRTSART